MVSAQRVSSLGTAQSPGNRMPEWMLGNGPTWVCKGWAPVCRVIRDFEAGGCGWCGEELPVNRHGC